MRLFPVLGTLAALMLLSSAPVSGQEKKDDAKYKFRKGDVNKFEVKSRLECTQAGTHTDFLVAGNDKPLLWTLNGTFENAVLAVNEADGAAQLERRVKQVSSFGHVQMPTMLDTFKFEWDREKGKPAPTAESLSSHMDKFAAEMIANPEKFAVDAEGNTTPARPEYKWLVMRRGMMYWPIKDEATWTTIEEMSLPMLHDKIKIEFKNTVKQDAVKTGYKARIITSTASVKDSTPAGFHAFEGLVITVAGKAEIEFDMTHGRVAKSEIDLKITFTAKGQVSGGGQGDVKGVATYNETQVYKD